MQKTLIIILFFLQTALFASDLEILDDRKKYTFRLLVTADTAFQHSLQVHVTERQLLHICPVSDRPFFYRITLPDERYFYALFTRHTFPIELVMPYRTLSRLLDEVDLVVGETVGERGQKLSKETFAKHGLVMDDVVRRKFLDKEESYIQARPSFLATKPFEEELAEQSQWLESWYAQIPSHIRQDLENNPYLLIDKETLPQLHPALVIRRAEKDLDPAELDDRKRRAFGMDAMIEQAARSRDITYSGLESERDILDAGRFKELEEDIESYIDCAYPTPLRSLQEKVEKMSKSLSLNTFYCIMILVYIIVIVVFICLIWLFYRILYGILMRRLQKNFNELQKIDF